MIPILVEIAGIKLYSFGLIVALAMFASIEQARISFSGNGLSGRLGEKYALLGTIVGLIGARLWHLAVNYESLEADLWRALVSSSGLVFHGGFLLAMVFLIALSRIDKIPFHKLADSAGAPLAMAYLVGRLGCQLSGDGDYGIESESLLAMSYSQGSVPTPAGVMALPTPLFESIGAAIILAALTLARSSGFWSKPYRQAAIYFLLTGTARFFMERLRINPKESYWHNLFPSLPPLTDAQGISILVAGLGLVFLTLSLLGNYSSASSASRSSSSSSSSSSS
ncbi:MAG: hypothetical protein DCC75_05935 [Proteobacteria bacterium]|nr:MAG: hypothetical protein DCC75_05935 [Pseudomonadota bacterium]